MTDDLRNLVRDLRLEAMRDHMNGRPDRAQVREEVARDLQDILEKERP